ncbi:hypothetical protein QQ045_011330 [Rhodiola kirilowii]
MNDGDVSKQIEQMELNIEKLQLVESEKKKIRQEYERIEKQVEVRKKILIVTCFFQSLLRLKEPSVLLRCRKADQDLVEGVLDSAREEYCGGIVMASRDGKIVCENSPLDARLDVVFRKKLPQYTSKFQYQKVVNPCYIRCPDHNLNGPSFALGV